MKKGSLIILSVLSILTLIIWFSCNPFKMKESSTNSLEENDGSDVVKATCCDAPIGFGQNAFGGTGGPTVIVTTTDAFLTAVDTVGPLIIQVSGSIESHNPSIRSDKTITAYGSGAALTSGLTIPRDSTNIIIKNLTITNPESDDGISILGSNVWVDHCTFVDCADGMVDITKGADYVTVSWCKFFYTYNSGHNFCNLIGSSDSDYGEYRATFHHNWYSEGCVERMPSVRFGFVHVFNNYYNCPGNNYCVRVRTDSEVSVESNYFENVQNPIEEYITIPPRGILHERNNIYDNCTWTSTGDRIRPANVEPFPGMPYGYTVDDAASVRDMVKAGAGAPLQ